MTNPFLRFSIKTTIVLLIIFILHLFILYLLKLPLLNNSIILCYLLNLIMVIGVFGALYFLRQKFKSQLGFLFLGGSVLKFAIFFIVFYPLFKEDGHVSKMEFASFFIPYAAGLIMETSHLSKWLQSMD